jgi:hypothetical protein
MNIRDSFFACDCARWYDIKTTPILEEDHFYIEPAHDSLEFKDTIGFFNDIIEVTGQFYSKTGYPNEYSSIENPPPGRVFRYTKYKVIESNYQSHLNFINEEKDK